MGTLQIALQLMSVVLRILSFWGSWKHFVFIFTHIIRVCCHKAHWRSSWFGKIVGISRKNVVWQDFHLNFNIGGDFFDMIQPMLWVENGCNLDNLGFRSLFSVLLKVLEDLCDHDVQAGVCAALLGRLQFSLNLTIFRKNCASWGKVSFHPFRGTLKYLLQV